MKVSELVEWLQAFEDQDAIVKVLHNEDGGGYYAQGGVTKQVVFDPEKYVELTDLRDNPFARARGYEGPPHEILLGLDEN